MYESLIREIARILLTDVAPMDLEYSGSITRNGPGYAFTVIGGPNSTSVQITVTAIPPEPAQSPSSEPAPAAAPSAAEGAAPAAA